MSNMVDSGQLCSFVERIERVEKSIRDEQEARKEIYAEINSLGFDAKVIRHIVKMRREDKAVREEFEALLELYLTALGQLAETPLGKSAILREFGASNDTAS